MASPGNVPASGYDEIDRYIEGRLDRLADELVAFCAIGSEGARRDELRQAADLTADQLRRLGATVTVISLPGAPDVPPLVVAELGKADRTLNLVNHYDVQPADPLEAWQSPPYEPQRRDGRLYARGATDNKGELLARLLGIEAYQAVRGPLPIRLRFLVEGEEEVGSSNLGALLDRGGDLRRAHGAVMEGGSIDPGDRPSIDCGVRGMLAVELVVRTAGSDLHSAMAAVVAGAAERLVLALATLWGADGSIALEGYLDDVRPPGAADRALVRGLPTDELEQIRKAYGIERLRHDLTCADALEAAVFEPTLNVQAMWSGHSGPAHKNVIPAEARARLDLRLVPDQSPDRVLAALREHLVRRGYADVAIEPLGVSYRPWWTPVDHPLVGAARAASEEVLGTPAIVSPATPGTAPMWEICSRHAVPAVSLGASRVDAMVHAPNENYRLADAVVAARITARFIDRFAGLDLADDPAGLAE